MNIFRDFEQRVKAVLETIDGVSGTSDLPLDRITAEPPRDASHGDVATNAAMVLAKPLATKPRALAEQDRRRSCAPIRRWPRSDVAGPGFINLRLKRRILAADALAAVIRRVLRLRTQRRSARPAQGQCRIRLGQSDRADACRPLPRRRGRRRARQPAGLRRL
jgi:arginyl-tRNA synthetase